MTKKRLRSFLCFVLVFAMVLGLIPATSVVYADTTTQTFKVKVGTEDGSGNWTYGSEQTGLVIKAKTNVRVKFKPDNIDTNNIEFLNEDGKKEDSFSISPVNVNNLSEGYYITVWCAGDFMLKYNEEEIKLNSYGLMIYNDIMNPDDDNNLDNEWKVIAKRDNNGTPTSYVNLDNIESFGESGSGSDWQSSERFIAYRGKDLEVKAVSASELAVYTASSNAAETKDLQIEDIEEAPKGFVRIDSGVVDNYEIIYKKGEDEESSINYDVSYPHMSFYTDSARKDITDDWHEMTYTDGKQTLYAGIVPQNEGEKYVKDIEFNGYDRSNDCDFSGKISGNAMITDKGEVPFTISEVSGNAKASGDAVSEFKLEFEEGADFEIWINGITGYEDGGEDDEPCQLTYFSFCYRETGLVGCRPYAPHYPYDEKLGKDVLISVNRDVNCNNDSYVKEIDPSWWDYELVDLAVRDKNGKLTYVSADATELAKLKLYQSDGTTPAASGDARIELVQSEGDEEIGEDPGTYFNLVIDKVDTYILKYDNNSKGLRINVDVGMIEIYNNDTDRRRSNSPMNEEGVIVTYEKPKVFYAIYNIRDDADREDVDYGDFAIYREPRESDEELLQPDPTNDEWQVVKVASGDAGYKLEKLSSDKNQEKYKITVSKADDSVDGWIRVGVSEKRYKTDDGKVVIDNEGKKVFATYYDEEKGEYFDEDRIVCEGFEVRYLTPGLVVKYENDEDNCYANNRELDWSAGIHLAIMDDEGNIEKRLASGDADKVSVKKQSNQEPTENEIIRWYQDTDNPDDCGRFIFDVEEQGNYVITYTDQNETSSVNVTAEFYGVELFVKDVVKKSNLYNYVDATLSYNAKEDEEYIGLPLEQYNKLYLKAGKDVERINDITIETAKKEPDYEDETEENKNRDRYIGMRTIGKREYYALDKNIEPIIASGDADKSYTITIPDTVKGKYMLSIYGDYSTDDGKRTEYFGQSVRQGKENEVWGNYCFMGDEKDVYWYLDDPKDEQLGFSGSFIPSDQFLNYGGFAWNNYYQENPDPIYWVHASTAQGVVDKLAAVAAKNGKIKAWTVPDKENNLPSKEVSIEIKDCKYIKIGPAPGNKSAAAIAAAKTKQTIILPDSIKGVAFDYGEEDGASGEASADASGEAKRIPYNFPETDIVSYHDAMVVVRGAIDDKRVEIKTTKVNLGYIADSSVKYTVCGIDNYDKVEKKADLSCGFKTKELKDRIGTSVISSYYIDPTGIVIATKPTKLVYTEGEKFDSKGMVISYTYANGLTGGKFTDYTVSNTNPLTVNDKSVKITYKGFEAEVAITVNAKPADTPPATVPAPVPDPGVGATTYPAVPEVGTTVETGSDVNGSFTVIDKGTAENSEPEVAFTKPDTSEAKVTIPATIKDANGIEYKVTAIDANAFKNDKKLTKVIIPATVETIGKNAFAGCKKLTTVTLGNSVEKIGQNAFANCSNLKKVTVTKSVTVIEKGAFNGCKKLKTITITSTKVTKIEKNAFKGIDKKATIKVPKKMLKQYKKLLKKAGFKGAVKGK